MQLPADLLPQRRLSLSVVIFLLATTVPACLLEWDGSGDGAGGDGGGEAEARESAADASSTTSTNAASSSASGSSGLSCDVDGKCTQTCQGGPCTVDCGGVAECNVQCVGTDCTVDCNGSGSCSVYLSAWGTTPATATVDCHATGTCTVDGQGSASVLCGNANTCIVSCDSQLSACADCQNVQAADCSIANCTTPCMP